MKKFLNWFKNSTKIKRWMFVILIGIVLTCFGFSKILISERLELKDLIIIISTFVIGFICFVFYFFVKLFKQRGSRWNEKNTVWK